MSKTSVEQGRGVYDVIAIVFVSFLLLANIAATKLFAVYFGGQHLTFDGGAILFPLTYVLGDVLAEIYGFRRTRRVVLIGFAMSLIAALTFWVVQKLPPAPGFTNQDAFAAILGFVPRIVLASLLAYVVGQLLNAYVLVAIRNRWGKKRLWVRLLGSTIVGEAADTIVFCTIAFYGIITGAEFLNYLVVGYFYKLLLEVILLPVTYGAIRWVRGREGILPANPDPAVTA